MPPCATCIFPPWAGPAQFPPAHKIVALCGAARHTARSWSFPRRNADELEVQNHEAVLHAFDPDNGGLIAQIPLPGNASGAPMTYMVDGKQFIVLPIGGAGQPAALVALRLP